MKQLILSAAIAISALTASASEGNVNEKVLNAFQTEFNTALNVTWEERNGYYKASFEYNDSHVVAYYDLNGTLFGITRNVSPLTLPFGLQKTLKEKYGAYWITGLFEVARNENGGYYITLENADTRIVLHAVDSYGWSVYSKEKKA